jgi:hypothetical protein
MHKIKYSSVLRRVNNISNNNNNIDNSENLFLKRFNLQKKSGDNRTELFSEGTGMRMGTDVKIMCGDGGGDGDGGCGDGEGTGTVGALRGGYGDQCLSPCHSLHFWSIYWRCTRNDWCCCNFNRNCC